MMLTYILISKKKKIEIPVSSIKIAVDISKEPAVYSFKIINFDPTPTSYGKDCIDIVITPITSIDSYHLLKFFFLLHFKSPLVSPPTEKLT